MNPSSAADDNPALARTCVGTGVMRVSVGTVEWLSAGAELPPCQLRATCTAVSIKHEALLAAYARKPVILAPLEDVSDEVFRRLCRGVGADVCVTEFVNVEGLLRGCRNARRKIQLADDESLTAIQIYGADPERLAEAARYAESADPIDRKSTRLNSSHRNTSRMPSSA